MATVIKKEKVDILNLSAKLNLVWFIFYIILLIGLGGWRLVKEKLKA